MGNSTPHNLAPVYRSKGSLYFVPPAPKHASLEMSSPRTVFLSGQVFLFRNIDSIGLKLVEVSLAAALPSMTSSAFVR